LSDAAGVVYDRQLLQFELDHGSASADLLARAEAAAEIRRDSGGHDLVAWATYRLGRFDEAWTAIEQARASGIADARISFHAGAIAVARGDRATGEPLLREALALGPALDPLERSEAQSLLGG
jgi:Flp pilus assembly protein TadD